MAQYGDQDERYYTCQDYVDRQGRHHRGRIFRARFEWDGQQWLYIRGSLGVFRFMKHDGARMTDDDDIDQEPSIAELFK